MALPAGETLWPLFPHPLSPRADGTGRRAQRRPRSPPEAATATGTCRAQRSPRPRRRRLAPGLSPEPGGWSCRFSSPTPPVGGKRETSELPLPPRAGRRREEWRRSGAEGPSSGAADGGCGCPFTRGSAAGASASRGGGGGRSGSEPRGERRAPARLPLYLQRVPRADWLRRAAPAPPPFGVLCRHVRVAGRGRRGCHKASGRRGSNSGSGRCVALGKGWFGGGGREGAGCRARFSATGLNGGCPDPQWWRDGAGAASADGEDQRGPPRGGE